MAVCRADHPGESGHDASPRRSWRSTVQPYGFRRQRALGSEVCQLMVGSEARDRDRPDAGLPYPRNEGRRRAQ
jgi:hypothetical protein